MAAIAFPQAQPREPQPLPPPVYPAVAAVAPNAAPVYVYNQTPAGGRPYLVAPEQAKSIIERFKAAYEKMGAPRVVIAVNRELVDDSAGMKLTSHKRVVETTRASDGWRPAAGSAAAGTNAQTGGHLTDRVVSTNIYRVRDPKEVPLADRQTMRDVERLFGRPLRMAGVQLADQRVAAQLMGAKAVDGFSVEPGSEQARRDREALANVADVVLEILVSSKDTTVSELSGERVYATPDIQATAIRLKDSRILGQATAADLIGQGSSAGRAMRSFGIREIAEATALSLMEDMMLE